METPLIIEQHIHGAFGVDFNTANVNDVLFVAENLLKHGIGGFFPTLVTDSVENIRRQIMIIKEASKENSRILGIHLEGIFINPEKKGIHNQEHFFDLTVEKFKLIEDDFIKIVTLAPELDNGLIDYLKSKKNKVQAGHCVGWGNVDGVTHTFNAMSGVSHRGISTSLKAMIEDNVYAEIIADGVHVSKECLELFFRTKASDKVILVSDALPITNSDLKEIVFADSKIYYDGKLATDKNGTIAGSTLLLDGVIKFLAQNKLFNPIFIENTYNYHGLKPNGKIVWDDEYNIISISEK